MQDREPARVANLRGKPTLLQEAAPRPQRGHVLHPQWPMQLAWSSSSQALTSEGAPSMQRAHVFLQQELAPHRLDWLILSLRVSTGSGARDRSGVQCADTSTGLGDC